MRSSGQFQTFLFILFFLRKVFARTKSTKSTKTQPSKSTKSTKTQVSELATFFPLYVFYAHTNAAFFGFFSLYAFCAFCACEIFSRIKKSKTALMTSFTLLLSKKLFFIPQKTSYFYWL